MFTVQKFVNKKWVNVSTLTNKTHKECNDFITSQAAKEPKEVYRITKAKQVKSGE